MGVVPKVATALPLLILASCAQCRDKDGDGYSTSNGDCNDENDSVYPGAEEYCDGIDNDCDGLVDHNALDTLYWYPDQDGDGYGALGDSVQSCEPPDGYVDNTTDCNDSNAGIHPGTLDTLLGEDANCDGMIGLVSFLGNEEAVVANEVGCGGDIDGDGLDDIILATNVGHSLISYGREDPNTEGIIDVTIRGGGSSVDIIPDINVDGYDDVLVGDIGDHENGVGAGAVYLILGQPDQHQGNVEAEEVYSAKFLGEDEYDGAGGAVSSAGDFNGDGVDDFVVGASRWSSGTGGRAYVILGVPPVGKLSLGEADIIMYGESGDQAGSSVASSGDMNGDGIDDILIGAPKATGQEYRSGAAYLVYGSESVTPAVDLSDMRMVGEEQFDSAGFSVHGGGDANGDGYDDCIVGAPESDKAANLAGIVYVVFGHSEELESMNLEDSDVQMLGVSDYSMAGTSVTVSYDNNGDKISDIIIGAGGERLHGGGTGAVYFVMGPILEGTYSLDNETSVVLYGGGDTDGVGVALSEVGDYDGDGYDDVLIGSSAHYEAGVLLGIAYLVLGTQLDG